MVFLVDYGRYSLDLPQAFIQEFTTRVTNNGGPMLLVIEIHYLPSYYMLCIISYGCKENTCSMLVVQRQVILNRICWVEIDSGFLEA
jgi:hypothetical protein